MAHHKNDLNSLMNWNPFRTHRDEKTHMKIQRHLTDINDIISEDDIRNIKLFAAVNEIEIKPSSKKMDITIH